MRQVQFFLFGLLLVWLTGTGKLRAFVDALRTEPPAASSTPITSAPRVVPNKDTTDSTDGVGAPIVVPPKIK